MKSNRRKIGDIVIDLTALLDVVFIILLVVLANQLTLQQKAKEEKDNYTNMTKEAEEKYSHYSDQISINDDYMTYITVVARFDEDNVKERTVSVMHGKDTESFYLSGNEASLTEFKTYIKERLDKYASNIDYGNGPKVLALNENEEKMLYRDEMAIKEVFEELKNEYSNVFIK